MSNVVYLQKPPPQIVHFLRVGYREHVMVDRLRSEGNLPSRRYVFEAGNVDNQRETIRELRDEGSEIILDTSVAEQSVPGLFAGVVGDAPWAHKDRPLEPEDFQPQTNRSVIEPIARFAVAEGFHGILAPTHYLGGKQLFWRDIDLRSCEHLRIALDREGGRGIAIDYPVILDNAQIKDDGLRRDMIAAIASLPIDNLWLRISGFGYNATGAGVEKIIRAVHALHELGIPIIIDRLGGLAAYALTSFGVASGFSNGLKGADSFNAYYYLHPRSGGGNDRAVFVAGLDRRVKVSEMQDLFSKSMTARFVYGCRDPSCCSSVDVMLREPEAHRARQQGRALADLSRAPEARRVQHFLDNYMEAAKIAASRAQRLKVVSADFRRLSDAAAVRLNRMGDTLEETSKRLGRIEFAPEAQLRTGVIPTTKGEREHP